VGGIDTFLQYPLTGLGGANYNYVALSYAPKANMIHNLYIGVFAETGLVGGVLFFGAMAYAVRTIWMTAIQDDDPIYLGLLAGFGGVFALQLFQPQYLRATSFVPLWIILGIACGRYRHQQQVRSDWWSRVWNGSRVVSDVRSARSTHALADVPRQIHDALRAGLAPDVMAVVRVRISRAIMTSAVVRSLRGAFASSAVGGVWYWLCQSSSDN
jgi:hypothetical protein